MKVVFFVVVVVFPAVLWKGSCISPQLIPPLSPPHKTLRSPTTTTKRCRSGVVRGSSHPYYYNRYDQQSTQPLTVDPTQYYSIPVTKFITNKVVEGCRLGRITTFLEGPLLELEIWEALLLAIMAAIRTAWLTVSTRINSSNNNNNRTTNRHSRRTQRRLVRTPP